MELSTKLSHKASLKKYKKMKYPFSCYQNKMKKNLVTNNNRSDRNYKNWQRLNNILLNDNQVNKEIINEIKKFYNLMNMKIQHTKSYKI